MARPRGSRATANGSPAVLRRNRDAEVKAHPKVGNVRNQGADMLSLPPYK